MLVFGQIIGSDAFSVGVAVAGFLIWSVFLAGAYYMAGESSPSSC